MAMPDHIRDAIWRIEGARLSTMEAPAAIVCGMGGSAIGGDLGAAALGDRLTRPMLVVRGYELPTWAPSGSAVLCSSYSGDTEETLACYDAAEALGAQRLVATTGGELAEAARRDGVPVIGLPAGLQPRAAVAYMFCSATELAVSGDGGISDPHRDRCRRRPPRGEPRGDCRQGRAARRAARRRHRGDLGQRSDRPDRLPVEVRAERERQGARLQLDPARVHPQRAGRLGRGQSAGRTPACCSRTATSIHGSGGGSSSPPS